MLDPVFDTERKALRRLVEALMSTNDEEDLVGKIEDAIIGAKIALGEDDYDQDAFLDNIEMLSTYGIVSQIIKEGKETYRVQVTRTNDDGTPGEEDNIDIFATSNQLISAVIDNTLLQFAKMSDPDNHS